MAAASGEDFFFFVEQLQWTQFKLNWISSVGIIWIIQASRILAVSIESSLVSTLNAELNWIETNFIPRRNAELSKTRWWYKYLPLDNTDVKYLNNNN